MSSPRRSRAAAPPSYSTKYAHTRLSSSPARRGRRAGRTRSGAASSVLGRVQRGRERRDDVRVRRALAAPSPSGRRRAARPAVHRGRGAPAEAASARPRRRRRRRRAPSSAVASAAEVHALVRARARRVARAPRPGRGRRRGPSGRAEREREAPSRARPPRARARAAIGRAAVGRAERALEPTILYFSRGRDRRRARAERERRRDRYSRRHVARHRTYQGHAAARERLLDREDRALDVVRAPRHGEREHERGDGPPALHGIKSKQ